MIVLPGLGADDLSTVPLRAFLRRLGHEVEGWALGRNRGNVEAFAAQGGQARAAR